jgi:hypothetical protein
MVFERKGIERADPHRSTELQNSKLDEGFAKNFEKWALSHVPIWQ